MATQNGIDSESGTTGQVLQANTSAAPTYSTATYPSTTTISQILYSSAGNVVSGLATANNGVLITSGGGVPSISSTLPSAVQGNITSVGTITSGVWNGTAINETHGGTNQTTYTLGDTLYASGANTLSKLAGSTTNTIKYLAQTGTGVVSAAPAWTTISGGDITGAALTEVNDTNVTLTLGGTPATALLRAASITAGWTGQLSLARGGTNGNLTASAGGIVWSDASQMQILSGTATASKMLLSGSSATPSWSTSTIPTSAGATANKVLLSDGTNYVLSTPTFPNASAASGKFIQSDGTNWVASTPTLPTSASTSGKVLQSDGTNFVQSTPTYPSASGAAGKILRSDGTNNVYTTSTFADTYSASNLLYSNGANTVTGLATANSASLVTNSTGVPAWSSTMTNGQVIIGSTGATPTAATLTAGTNVTVTNGAASITLASPTGNLTSFTVLTSGTAATYTTPAGINSILVECVGGGGGGGGSGASAGQGGAGSGGGGGGYCRKFIASASATYTYTVGPGGAGGATGNNAGIAGTATTFSTLSAGGGGAGQGTASSASAGEYEPSVAGGSSSGGDINISGGSSGPGVVCVAAGAGLSMGGVGGNSFYGSGAGIHSASGGKADGNNAPNYGGGGGGGATANTASTAAGGAGANGIIIVWEFK